MFDDEHRGARFRRSFAFGFYPARPVAKPARDLLDPRRNLSLGCLKDRHKLILGPAEDHVVGADRRRKPVSQFLDDLAVQALMRWALLRAACHDYAERLVFV